MPPDMVGQVQRTEAPGERAWHVWQHAEGETPQTRSVALA